MTPDPVPGHPFERIPGHQFNHLEPDVILDAGALARYQQLEYESFESLGEDAAQHLEHGCLSDLLAVEGGSETRPSQGLGNGSSFRATEQNLGVSARHPNGSPAWPLHEV